MLLHLAHVRALLSQREGARRSRPPLKHVGRARREGAPGDLESALIEVAAASLAWAQDARRADAA